MTFGSIAIPVPLLVWIVLIVGAVVYPWALRLGLKVIYGMVRPQTWRDRVIRRYRVLGAFPWTFAWFKLRLDAMFQELPGFISEVPGVRSGLDVGCGYGLAASAILEWRPGMTMVGVDPNARRVRAAAAVFGRRGRAIVGAAPDFEIPAAAGGFDIVLMLDMIHYISNEALAKTLARVRGGMTAGGKLIIRSNIPPASGAVGTWKWKYAVLSRRITRAYVCLRSVEEIRGMIAVAGFEMEACRVSGGNQESWWFVARALAAVVPAGVSQTDATATETPAAE